MVRGGIDMNIKMKKADQFAAIVLLLFSAFVIFESSRMTLQVEFAPGYGFFPFWLGTLMAVLSIILFINARTQVGDGEGMVVLPNRATLLNVGLILGGLGLYAFLMEIAGYVLDTFILVILLLGVVERERWQICLLSAVLMTASLYVIFQVILGVNLPTSVFGF